MNTVEDGSITIAFDAHAWEMVAAILNSIATDLCQRDVITISTIERPDGLAVEVEVVDGEAGWRVHPYVDSERPGLATVPYPITIPYTDIIGLHLH